MQINCSSALVEKPVLALRLSSPSRPEARRKIRQLVPARIATAPVPDEAIAPLWFLAKGGLASCEGVESLAWLALALSAAVLLIGSLRPVLL